LYLLTIGLPGSARRHSSNAAVSHTAQRLLRTILFDDITEPVSGNWCSPRYARCRPFDSEDALNYVDATNLSPHERRQWIKMARASATMCRRFS
jgi:hypothetical protein